MANDNVRINKGQIFVKGRVILTPVMRKTASGRDVTNFNFVDGSRVDPQPDGSMAPVYYRIVAFDQYARFCAGLKEDGQSNIRHGMTISLTGQLQVNEYTNPETGKVSLRNELIIDNLSTKGASLQLNTWTPEVQDDNEPVVDTSKLSADEAELVLA